MSSDSTAARAALRIAAISPRARELMKMRSMAAERTPRLGALNATSLRRLGQPGVRFARMTDATSPRMTPEQLGLEVLLP